MIAGIGTDLVEIDRIERMIERYGDAFLGKVFTPEEVAFCSARARPAQHYAARFAAKEAVLKALGTGVRKGMTLRDVQVESDTLGAPRVLLSRGAKAKAEELGVTVMHVSLTHTNHHAGAYVVAECREGAPPSC